MSEKEIKYIKSSPYFFKMIIVSMVILVGFILVGSFFSSAPLLTPAESYNVPNPSKAAWFLIWLQELVSYSSYLVYLVLALFLYFLFLPFFTKTKVENAKWFNKKLFFINILVLIITTAIVLMTIIAYYFRVEYWALKF